jgi:hypothetical protein
MDSKLVIVIFCIFTFLAGLYFYVTIDEPFETNKKQNASCPDVLIRRGGSLLLYNSKDPNAEVLPFYNIDEYINYLEIQRRAGKVCPVLFLQYESTAQGKDIYRMRPSPFDLQGGTPPNIDPTVFGGLSSIDGNPIQVLDANRDGEYNQGMYAGFDPYGLHTGQRTELDVIHESTAKKGPNSENPMDFNWGGTQVTENAVRSGAYEDRYVSKPQYFTPKTTYLPDIYGAGSRPPNEVPDILKSRAP